MIGTFLGTGTSQGIPVIGCTCDTCLSSDPRDKRLRCSFFIKHLDKNILIDVGPDFRAQMLQNNLDHVDFVLFTHEHNDHTAGIDDLRPINFMTRKHMDVYGQKRVIEDLKVRFAYAFDANPYPGAPRINTHVIDQLMNIQGIDITPVHFDHGLLPIIGYRIGNLAYLTDVSSIPESSYKLLRNVDTLVISALRNEPHHSHLTVDQALEEIKKIKPKHAYLIHMSHHLPPTAQWEDQLPTNVHLAYDGLQITIN